MPESSPAELALNVKQTERRGKLLAFQDDDADAGVRGMTDAERHAHDYIRDIIEDFDTADVEPGRVGTVYVPADGDPWVEWSSDDAAAEAGGENGAE